MTTRTERTSTLILGVEHIHVSGLTEFEFRVCGLCDIPWGMPKTYVDARRSDGRGFMCPNGHKWRYSGETKEEKLRREVRATKDALARTRADLDQTAASLRSTKGVVTKMRKRVGNGVCPCCKRTFKDLARHMDSQHPDFKKKGAF